MNIVTLASIIPQTMHMSCLTAQNVNFAMPVKPRLNQVLMTGTRVRRYVQIVLPANIRRQMVRRYAPYVVPANIHQSQASRSAISARLANPRRTKARHSSAHVWVVVSASSPTKGRANYALQAHIRRQMMLHHVVRAGQMPLRPLAALVCQIATATRDTHR